MSKRNLIILITGLIIIIVVFGFLFLNKNQPKEEGEGTNFGFDFNPFNNKKPTPSGDGTTPPVDVSGYVPPPETETQVLKLKKVSSMPIAGYGIFMKEVFKDTLNPSLPLPLSGEGNSSAPPAKGDSGGLNLTPPPTEFVPAVRYVARANGNIYQTFTDTIIERKFSTTIIPKVYEAYFGNKGDSVIMRYLKGDDRTIQTFLGTLPKEYLGADSAGINEVVGSFLPDNIMDVSISPDTTKIFYIFKIGNSSIGIIADLIGNKKTQIFDSPFTEWLSSWPNEKMITIATKPSAGVPGFMYIINPDRKDLKKVLGGINGLTTLTSPNGKLVLYNNNNLSLSVYQTDTGNSNTLGVKTLAEKCVWSKGNENLYCAVPQSINNVPYPDAWYKGEVSFNDSIWKIDLESGMTTLLVDPTTSPDGEEIDGIKPMLDEGENYLFFVNKKDSFLWKLDLK